MLNRRGWCACGCGGRRGSEWGGRGAPHVGASFSAKPTSVWPQPGRCGTQRKGSSAGATWRWHPAHRQDWRGVARPRGRDRGAVPDSRGDGGGVTEWDDRLWRRRVWTTHKVAVRPVSAAANVGDVGRTTSWLSSRPNRRRCGRNLARAGRGRRGVPLAPLGAGCPAHRQHWRGVARPRGRECGIVPDK